MLPDFTNAFLVLTHSCNLRCRYCFVSQNKKTMTLQVAKDSIDFLARDETKQTRITFFGGEPMLSFDQVIVPLVAYGATKYGSRVSFSITTNGTLLSEDRLKFLSNNRVGLLLSIDGNKSVQDYNRPYASSRSSFDDLDHIIPSIISYYPRITFRSTIISDTVSGLYEGILYAIENGFKYYFCMPNSYEDWSEDSKVILSSQIRLFADYFIAECRERRNPIFFSTFNRMFDYIKRINLEVNNSRHRSINRCHSCGSCGIGSGLTCAIDPEGRIFTCQEMTSNLSEDTQFCIGNIYEGINTKKRTDLIELYDSTDTIGSDCKKCLLDPICDGGCIANNYLITGNMRHMPSIQCYWNQLLLDEAIRVARLLGEENNATFLRIWGGINE